MAEVLLFHHIQGLTPGVVAFADELRAAGHTVHTPDLYGGSHLRLDPGRRGVHAKATGHPTSTPWPTRSAAALPAGLVYAGFSFGVSQAQRLAQTRPGRGRRAALRVLHPDHRRVGVRAVAGGRPGADPRHGRRRVLRPRGRHRRRPRDRREGRAGAELFVYPGDKHLFADSSLPSYDAEAAALLTERVLAFLARV